MIQHTLSGGARRRAARVALIFAAIASACQSGSTTDETAAPGPSAAASAIAGGPAGPCGEWLAKLCQSAGTESPSCLSAKNTADLLPAAACKSALQDFAYSEKKLGEQRKDCDTLVKKLCTDLGPTTESCAMVTTETKKFPPERCSMFLQRYSEVLGDLKKKEAANQPLSKELQSEIAAGDAPAFGPKDAKVTIVEFSDFECPYCSRAADVAGKIREKYGNRVRFVFRQFPLSFHPNAQKAAEAALFAHTEGKFWTYHDRLFANQRALDRASLEKYAKESGVNVAKLKQALDSNRYAEQVKRDLALGEKVAVQGTPTMFVNGKRVPNPTEIQAVSALIEEALKG